MVKRKISIVTDAWLPQINGVVTTLVNIRKTLINLGYDVDIISHNDMRIKIPSGYPNVFICFFLKRKIDRDSLVHISTPEGFVGRSVRHYCDKNDIDYTTAYHTNWPLYLWLPKSITEWYMRRVHRNSMVVLVPTKNIENYLHTIGITHTKIWTRGVDREYFHP